jgi:hypothetical protein
MNAQQVIDQLPAQAKRSVLFTLVGSINASLVGAAASMASKLERDGYDFKELEPRDITTLFKGSDEQSPLLDTRRLARVGSNLREQLIELSFDPLSNKPRDDTQGDINKTIDFMTSGKARAIDMTAFDLLVEAGYIKGVDPRQIAAANEANARQRGERLAAQRGAVEYIIEHVLTVNGYDDVNGDGPAYVSDTSSDTIECLNKDMQARLHDKLLSACVKSKDNTILALLNHDQRVSFGDLPSIDAAIDDATQLTVH